MSDPAFDRRVDELMALGDRCARLSGLFRKVTPYYAGHGDHQALGRIERVLRRRFWDLAHTIAGELPR